MPSRSVDDRRHGWRRKIHYKCGRDVLNLCDHRRLFPVKNAANSIQHNALLTNESVTLLDQNPQTGDPLEAPELETPVDDRNRVVPAIEFRDVELAFDDVVVLDKVDFTVRRAVFSLPIFLDSFGLRAHIDRRRGSLRRPLGG